MGLLAIALLPFLLKGKLMFFPKLIPGLARELDTEEEKVDCLSAVVTSALVDSFGGTEHGRVAEDRGLFAHPPA